MFIASNRWLDRFKKCCGLYEKEWLAEEADCEAAAEYPEYLKKLMEGNGHLPEEVFKADETVLFWKHMPTCTSIAKDEKKTRGFKPGKDKLKILLCSNVSGDFLIKSMLLHRFQNSCPLKRECQKHFSVYMKGNHKIWITEKHFLDWFLKCFISEVKQYLNQKNLQFKVLQILNTTLTDKSVIVNANPCVKVISIPPNTNPLLQPMHLRVPKMFMMYYTRSIFDYLADFMKETPEIMVKVAWQNFSICNTLTIVEESVREIKQSTLNGGWQKLWNEVVTNSRSFLPVVEEIENVVASAKCLSGEGFEDIELNDIAELLDSHPQQIVEKYFRDVITAKVDKRGQQRLTSRTRRMLKHSLCKSNCRDDSEERDPLVEYLLTFRQGLNDYLQLYKAVRRILQTRPISLFSLLASTGEKRLDHRAVCCSNPFRTSRQKGCIQIVEPWDSEFDSSDDVVIHMLEDESGAED
uniref:DDE-1 domain-containing protein n=1 Tax=Equus asinus TaxID=9793 RepID=A0A9L0KC63_EQUAS|nr:tigger transposable element-derived protein 1-like isoform X1 [Equus asinus]XP_044619980.1 tigger transposable element-derived protein 1-like isoform X1 [Equus asinus]XP_044619981.1 tigger transposable element-derived protein 1-like isoform X1 [Equus asinus]XP_044619982.1 tigger transposable element-derived protein 1-like isoform X1 [Equus asinus]XP_044619983.1 tigger transposable element-derived protein 1-like isoform X1 [Equus asinus]XP_044619984.1 tigger transposable element-derived prot